MYVLVGIFKCSFTYNYAIPDMILSWNMCFQCYSIHLCVVNTIKLSIQTWPSHLRWHSRPFWAKLATNIDPAIAMHITIF